MSGAAGARAAYADMILDMPAGPGRRAEIRQMLIDLLDVVEQTPDENPLIAAIAAYDEVAGTRPSLAEAVELAITSTIPRLPYSGDGARALGVEVAKLLGVPAACVTVTLDDGLTVEYQPPGGAARERHHRERLGDPAHPHPWMARP